MGQSIIHWFKDCVHSMCVVTERTQHCLIHMTSVNATAKHAHNVGIVITAENSTQQTHVNNTQVVGKNYAQ